MSMGTKTLSRWEQDPMGGENGKMTFCFLTGEVTVRLASFSEAHELQLAIQQEMKEVRRDARAGLINQIARIEP